MLQVDKMACELSTAPLAQKFGFTRVHAFLLQVGFLTAVPSFCRLSLKIFLHVCLWEKLWSIFIGQSPMWYKIKSRDILSLPFYTVAEGSPAF